MTDTNERPDQTGASAPSSAADDWADALAEQSRNAPPTQADGLRGQDDWASAMAEQNAAAPAAPAAAPAPQSAAQTVFKPLTSKENAGGADIDLIMDVPVQLTVELGRTRLTIKNLLQLGQG
ncbi:FliM/FliN family flagellar motor switch protein, partial [Bordetella hinzii]|nr:FliM/FliN family flagellar motor switch protein [Bordetella hinzii]